MVIINEDTLPDPSYSPGPNGSLMTSLSRMHLFFFFSYWFSSISYSGKSLQFGNWQAAISAFYLLSGISAIMGAYGSLFPMQSRAGARGRVLSLLISLTGSPPPHCCCCCHRFVLLLLFLCCFRLSSSLLLPSFFSFLFSLLHSPAVGAWIASIAP